MFKWKQFLSEAGFSRIKNILQGTIASVYTVGFMTGWNPQAQQLARKRKPRSQ